MSLGAKLTNVFFAPGEVFEETIRGPLATVNWLVPVLLLCLAGIVSSFVIFSQDAILQQIREQQARVMEKKLEKLPQAQRDQIMEMAEKWSGPGMLKILGSAGAVVRSFAWVFFAAVVMWLVGTRVFKGDFVYLQAVEVCGVAAMISVLGTVISTLLAVVMSNTLATPGPALLIRDPDTSNLGHLCLATLNVMTFWYLGVLSIGLAKLSRASVAKAACWLFGIWAVVSAGMIFVGWGTQHLF